MITNNICTIQDNTDIIKNVSFEDFVSGNAKAIVNAARVSFNNIDHEPFNKKDEKLVEYLKAHEHKSPFFHLQKTFAVSSIEWNMFCIFVMRNPLQNIFTQDELSSVKFYVDQTNPKELFTYITISQWFYSKLLQYADVMDFQVNVIQEDFSKIKNKQAEIIKGFNHVYNTITNPFKNLTLCLFEPTFDWLKTRANILEASRIFIASAIVETPLFVFNQLVKHRKAEVNAISYRYVKPTKKKFWQPTQWRKQAETNKQGSSKTEFVEESEVYKIENNGCGNIIETEISYNSILCDANKWYNAQIKNEMCGELARIALPQSTFTSFVWTFDLYTFARICKLRISPNAQLETQEVVEEVLKIVKARYPIIEDLIRLF